MLRLELLSVKPISSQKKNFRLSKADIDDIDKAKNDLTEAIAKSKKELNKIFAVAREKMDEVRAAIFEAQLMILDDPILLNEINRRVEAERKSPEYIVDDEISKYQSKMILSHEAYMKERALDIEDIKQRIIRNLQKKRWESKIESQCYCSQRFFNTGRYNSAFKK